MSDKREGRAPATFDDVAFAEDLARSGEVGRVVALQVRAEYERRGVPVEALLACADQGRDGTRLANCVKVYLPRPAGRFGMVLRIEKKDGKPVLAFAAFGVRHHPPESNAPTVYEIAHRRLHAGG